MTCPQWEERIALLAGGDLNPADAGLTEQHLAGCPDCRELAAALRRSLDLLQAAHNAPIAEAHFTAVRARVLEQLASTSPGSYQTWWRRKWILGLAAALVLLALFVATRQNPVTPPPQRAIVHPAPITPRVAPPADSNAPVRPLRPHRLLASARRVPGPTPLVEPTVVKLITDDPDVVIYWIADK